MTPLLPRLPYGKHTFKNQIYLNYFTNWCRLIFISYMTYMTYYTNRRHPPSRWLSGDPWWTNLPKKEDAQLQEVPQKKPPIDRCDANSPNTSTSTCLLFCLNTGNKSTSTLNVQNFPIINKTWVFFHFGQTWMLMMLHNFPFPFSETVPKKTSHCMAELLPPLCRLTTMEGLGIMALRSMTTGT